MNLPVKDPAQLILSIYGGYVSIRLRGGKYYNTAKSIEGERELRHSDIYMYMYVQKQAQISDTADIELVREHIFGNTENNTLVDDSRV